MQGIKCWHCGPRTIVFAQIANIFSRLKFDFLFILTLSVYLSQTHNVQEFDKTHRGLQVAHDAHNTLTDCH